MITYHVYVLDHCTMATSSSVSTSAASSDPTLCKLVATVPTGLEGGAADECREALKRDVVAERGRISFHLSSLAQLHKVNDLRAVDNYSVIVQVLPDFCKTEETVLERLEALPSGGGLNWDTPLSVWRYYNEIVIQGKTAVDCAPDDTGSTVSTESSKQSSSCSTSQSDSLAMSPESPSKPITFRVTCTRSGRKHAFSSMEAAGKLGAGLACHFGWKVQLKNSALEVLLNIVGDCATVAFALNRESKYKRNVVEFGPTTLRSTIAYGLLRFADIKCGDVVVDPMCGGGSINIEGTLAWPGTFHLAGDNHELATPRAKANLTALKEQRDRELMVDVLRWDVCNLPLRTASVDIVVTDLPFGKKSGSRRNNWELYPSALQELGRVCRPVSSRAIFLTHDNKAFSAALQKSTLWRRHQTRWISVGGLTAAVYILYRSKQTCI